MYILSDVVSPFRNYNSLISVQPLYRCTLASCSSTSNTVSEVYLYSGELTSIYSQLNVPLVHPKQSLIPSNSSCRFKSNCLHHHRVYVLTTESSLVPDNFHRSRSNKIQVVQNISVKVQSPRFFTLCYIILPSQNKNFRHNKTRN